MEKTNILKAMEKIDILKAMIDIINERRKSKSPAGLCSSFMCVAISCNESHDLFEVIPEILDYKPDESRWLGAFWFHPRDYDKRIGILKEIIKKLEAEINGKD